MDYLIPDDTTSSSETRYKMASSKSSNVNDEAGHNTVLSMKDQDEAVGGREANLSNWRTTAG